MSVWAIAATSLRRLVRNPTGLFFALALPLLLIVLLGLLQGGFETRLGLVVGEDGPLAVELADAIRDLDGITVTEFDDEEALRAEVQRDDMQAGVVIGSGYDVALRRGDAVAVEFLTVPDALVSDLRALVDAEVAVQATRVRSAQVATAETGAGFDAALAAADAAAAVLPGVEVVAVDAADGAPAQALGDFDRWAATNLVLFLFFIAATAGASQLVTSRDLGVSRRMLATPTPARQIILGETVGRFVVAILQAAFIVAVGMVFFGVDWGNWPATAALIVLFALVGAGAGMLLGTLFRNEQQAGSVGIFVALFLGALGNAMFPLDGAPAIVSTISHLTPHRWAMDGFLEVMRYGGDLSAIAAPLAVLAGFSAVLLSLATWRFRRVVTR